MDNFDRKTWKEKMRTRIFQKSQNASLEHFFSETNFSENHFLLKDQPIFLEKCKVIDMLIYVMFCFLK